MSKKLCGIYCIRNIIDGKRYIGMSRDIKRRWSEHRVQLNKNSHINVYLQSAWNKYGSNNFSFEIIELCEEELLSDRECYYIQTFNTLAHYGGYNLTVGGENTSIGRLVIKLDDLEIFQTVINAAERANVVPATMSIWCKNRHGYMYLDEYNTLSPDEQQYYRNFDWKSYDHNRLSKAHSSEMLSDDTKEKLSKATSGSKNPRAFKVYCPELDEIFDCAKYATDKYGINRGSIGQCIKGKLKSAGCHPITGEKLTWVRI